MNMTIYQTEGRVAGQPISPSFGAQNGAGGGGVVAIPAGMSMLEAMSRGILPRNAQVTSINGVGASLTTIDDLMSNGAGNQLNLGTSTPNVAGNPAGNGAINQQEFVDGTSAASQTVNGPTPTAVESLTSCPVSGATLGTNISLAGTFQG